MNAWSLSRIAIAALSCLVPAVTPAADTIKIAQIDPMSGPFGLVGESLGQAPGCDRRGNQCGRRCVGWNEIRDRALRQQGQSRRRAC